MSVQAVNPIPVGSSAPIPDVETDNGILYAAISRIYQTVLNENFFQSLQSKAVWVWNTTMEAIKSEWMVISLIAFTAFYAFGFAVALQASVIFTFARIAIVTWQDQGAQKNVDRLSGENLILRLRNQEILEQVEIEQLRAQRAEQERDLNIQELGRVRQDRDDIILQRAPLLAERDRLQVANQRFLEAEALWTQARDEMTARVAQMTQERDEAVHAREDQAGALERAQQNADRFGEQLGRVQTFETFNDLLAQLLAMYQGRQQGALPDLDQRLIAQYRATRAEWNQKLEQHIQTMDLNDKARIQLERILASSQGEMEHLQGLFATFQLHLALQVQRARQLPLVEV